MAVDEDYNAYFQYFPRWGGLLFENNRKVHSVLLCSPDLRQQTLIKQLFPLSEIIVSQKDRWNLYYPCPYQADLIVACNVFHYLSQPQDAFKHLFAACRFFWLQDLFARRRGVKSEFADDGDCMRYGLGLVPENGFDLGVYKERLLDFRPYDGGSFRNSRATIHFAASFRGDLT